MGRKLLKLVFWVLILALLVMPLGLIYRISQAEMAEYATSKTPVIKQSAVGAPTQVMRQDVALYVNVNGTFTSTAVAFMELDYRKPYDIRWIVSYGDEIQVDQVLGYYYGEEIISTVDGIISNINTSASKPYLQVDCFSPLVLECQLEDSVLKSLKMFKETLHLAAGGKVTFEHIARVKNHDGTTTVRLSLEREGDVYGAAAEDLTVYLGTSYPNVLTLPMECVYQKVEGEEEPWFAREVTEDGFVISERQITVSYTNGIIAIVSGVEEGQWFDAGYKAVAGDGK